MTHEGHKMSDIDTVKAALETYSARFFVNHECCMSCDPSAKAEQALTALDNLTDKAELIATLEKLKRLSYGKEYDCETNTTLDAAIQAVGA